MSTPPQPGMWDRFKSAVNPRKSEPVSPSFEGAPRNPAGVLNKKKIVWKDAPRTSSSSATASDSELERFVREALPGAMETPGAIKNFVQVAKESLAGAAAASATSAIPGVGAVAGLASAGYKAHQAQSMGGDVEHLKDTFGATGPELQMCSLSMARHLKDKQSDKLKHAGLDVAAAAANAGLSATGLGAAITPGVGLLKMTAEKAMAVQNLWDRYKAMEQGNNFLAQASVDSTNYYHAVEACPELAAYVLATCDPDGVSAKLGKNSLSPGQIAMVRKIAVEMIKESPLEIRTGEPPQSKNVPLVRSPLVGGDVVGAILLHDVGRPKSATERASLWKKNQVVPFDEASNPASSANSARPADVPSIRTNAWGPGTAQRPAELGPVLAAWPTQSSDSSTPVQPYNTTAVEKYVQG